MGTSFVMIVSISIAANTRRGPTESGPAGGAGRVVLGGADGADREVVFHDKI